MTTSLVQAGQSSPVTTRTHPPLHCSHRPGRQQLMENNNGRLRVEYCEGPQSFLPVQFLRVESAGQVHGSHDLLKSHRICLVSGLFLARQTSRLALNPVHTTHYMFSVPGWVTLSRSKCVVYQVTHSPMHGQIRVCSIRATQIDS